MEKQSTRELILQTSAGLIHEKGFNNTGLQEILDSAGVPKGSFYFYFDSKEALGLAVLDYFTALIDGLFAKYLLDTSVPPLGRLEKLLRFYENHFRKTGYRLGCPIGNLSLEMGDINEKFRGRLHSSIQKLVSRLENCLSDAKEQGAIPADLNIKDAAAFIFHGFEGALLHMKVVKGPEPLVNLRKNIMNYLKN